MLKKTLKKTKPNLKIEQEYQGVIAGIDEVGRGPWAGPVVACSLIFLNHKLPDNLSLILNDSKKLSEKKRLEIFDILTHSDELCRWGLGEASVEEIDKINIHQATFLAMERSYQNLGQQVDIVLVDGRSTPQLPCRAVPVIGGDSKSFSIAAASVIAKVHRDRYMRELAKEFPHYSWQTNAGYGTKQHQEALNKYGPTQHHRTSFAPIRELIKAA